MLSSVPVEFREYVLILRLRYRPKETFDAFNVNVFGMLNVTRAVLPYMRAQKSGVIAHFGSVGSWGGAPAAGIYSSTKWAISGVTESLYPELAPFGINVVVIVSSLEYDTT